MTPAEHGARLDELQGWISEVLYPNYGDYLRDQRIEPCWPEHPAAINELSWLYNEWHNAYLPDERKPRDAADWHDRWLPGVLRRLDEVFRACGHRAQAIRDRRTSGDRTTR
jgi:hypothetical protein